MNDKERDKDSKEEDNKEIDSELNNLEKIDLNKPDITKIVLLKKEGQPFKKDEKIVKYFIKNKEKPIIIKAPIYGWIFKYISEEKKIILERCRHETFYINLCVKCGFKKNADYDTKNETKGYGFLTNDFSYSKEKAESLEKSVVSNYLQNQKLILLLDLDNTILHCYSSQIIGILPDEIKFLQDKYKFYFGKIPMKNEINRTQNILIKFRPFLKTFLKNIKNKYEIFIYTHGTKEYATSIIQYINLNFESDSLSTRRMLCRVIDDNGIPKIKSIKNVFPTQEEMVLIIDDNMEAWKESGDNIICIYPYKFFIENEKSKNELESSNNKDKIKEKFLKYDYDNVLFCITNLLLCVHRKFYEYYSKFHFPKSIRLIISELLLSVFQGKTFYYHLNYYKCSIKKLKKKKNKETKHQDIEIKKDNENNEKSNSPNNVIYTNINLKNNDKKEENMIAENIEIQIDNKEDGKKEEPIIQKDFPKRNLEIEKNKYINLKYKIEKLGGKLIEEEKDIFNSDLFLTDFYDEKDPIFKKVEENNLNDKNKKLPILHCDYIEICLMYIYQVSINDFLLSPKTKILKFLDLNQIFNKNKIDIINYYENKDFFDEN